MPEDSFEPPQEEAAGEFLSKPDSEAAKAWLAEPHPMRFQEKHLMVPVGKAFDVLAYFSGATAAARAVN